MAVSHSRVRRGYALVSSFALQIHRITATHEHATYEYVIATRVACSNVATTELHAVNAMHAVHENVRSFTAGCGTEGEVTDACATVLRYIVWMKIRV